MEPSVVGSWLGPRDSSSTWPRGGAEPATLTSSNSLERAKSVLACWWGGYKRGPGTKKGKMEPLTGGKKR